jgi:hypothetical protein
MMFVWDYITHEKQIDIIYKDKFKIKKYLKMMFVMFMMFVIFKIEHKSMFMMFVWDYSSQYIEFHHSRTLWY